MNINAVESRIVLQFDLCWRFNETETVAGDVCWNLGDVQSCSGFLNFPYFSHTPTSNTRSSSSLRFFI